MEELKKTGCKYCVEGDEQRANWIVTADITVCEKDGFLYYRNEKRKEGYYIPIKHCPMCGRKL